MTYRHVELLDAGVSVALPLEQKTLAQDVARHIGIEYNEVSTFEGSDEGYIANLGKRYVTV